MDWLRVTSRNLAADGAVPDHCRRLSDRGGQSERVRARLGRCAVRRPRLRRVCAEVRAAGAARHARPAALPLLRGHSIRRRMVPRPHQHRGLKANFAGLCGLAAAGVVSLLIFQAGAANLPQALGMFAGSGTSTPTLQAILDALQQPGRRGRLQRHLPVWRRRPDPVHVRLPGALQAADCAAGRSPAPAGRSQRAQCRSGSAARSLELQRAPAERRPGRRHPRARAEPRADAVHALAANDVLLIVGTDPAAMDEARAADWRSAAGEVAADRTAPRLLPRLCVEARASWACRSAA